MKKIPVNENEEKNIKKTIDLSTNNFSTCGNTQTFKILNLLDFYDYPKLIKYKLHHFE